MSWLLLTSVAIVLTGCGVGAGGDQGELERDLGFSTDASYVMVDLDAQTVLPLAEMPADLDTNDRWRSSAILFRQVPAVTGLVLGLGKEYRSMSHSVDLNDENQRFSASTESKVSIPSFYMSVFEVTRGQWRRLAGSEPWKENTVRGGMVRFSSVQVGNQEMDGLPACGMTADQIDVLLAAQGWCRLALPSRNQWEYACRGKVTTPYPWGDGTDFSVFSPFAVLQTDKSLLEDGVQLPTSPAVVGIGRTGNAFGLWDMVGNIAEFTSDRINVTQEALVCGGSWSDVVRNARATNAVRLAKDLPHPLVGLRLVVKP